LKELPALLDVQQVAELLNCSTRHVIRMVSEGRMPAPFKLRTLARWHRLTLEKWLSEGCPPVGSGKDNN